MHEMMLHAVIVHTPVSIRVIKKRGGGKKYLIGYLKVLSLLDI
jgi:hypothetical protein